MTIMTVRQAWSHPVGPAQVRPIPARPFRLPAWAGDVRHLRGVDSAVWRLPALTGCSVSASPSQLAFFNPSFDLVALRPPKGACKCPRSVHRVQFTAIVDHVDHYEMKMTNMDQERWLRVKDRLRIEVGEDIYLSWFARMELDAVELETIKLSVPTRFLKSWIQSHYAEKLLGCWQSEQPTTTRIELTVRSAAIRQLPLKIQPAEPPAPLRESKVNGHEPRGLMPPVRRGA